MKKQQISQLLGINVSNSNKKEALEIGNNLLFKVIKLFKKHTFGIITFYGISPSKIKHHQTLLQNADNFLKLKGFNFIKISVQWNLKFKDVLNFREIGYFILNPTFEDMIEITKRFDQNLFIYSNDKDTQVYYDNGSKINLEKDTFDFGTIAGEALILNFIDFKLFIDTILDYHFNFLKRSDIKIDDRIVVFSKSNFTHESTINVIDVYDIRQNGIISFERSKVSPAISPKVFHFDEIIWAFKLGPQKVSSSLSYYRNAV